MEYSFFTGAAEIKDSTLDRKAAPAFKAFNESRPRRLRRPRHLMSLALPVKVAQNRTTLYYENESRDCATRHVATCDTPCHT